MKTQRIQPLLSWIKETIITILLAIVISVFLRAAVVEARIIPSTSMEPTLQVGDRVITDKIIYRFTGLRRGDIIVFNPPFESDIPFIKRIVGLPGDTVCVRDGTVYVNESPLNEPYTAEPPAYDFGPVVVPEGKYLVLGDNRNQSFDSHSWGFVSGDQIIARAVFRFWPLSRFGSI